MSSFKDMIEETKINEEVAFDSTSLLKHVGIVQKALSSESVFVKRVLSADGGFNKKIESLYSKITVVYDDLYDLMEEAKRADADLK